MGKKDTRSSDSDTIIIDGMELPRYKEQSRNKEVESVLSKLVAPIDQEHSPYAHKVNEVRDRPISPPKNVITEVLDGVTSNIEDNHSIYELLPDIRLASRVLTASILSPNDMIGSDFKYALKATGVPVGVTSGFVRVISDYFKSTYDLNSKAPTILQKALFDDGAYITAILPETTIDTIINSDQRITTESLTDLMASDDPAASIGLLGSDKTSDDGMRVGLESLTHMLKIDGIAPKVQSAITAFVNVLDNPSMLKIPSLHKKLRSQKVSDVLSRTVGVESYKHTDHLAWPKREYDNSVDTSTCYVEVPDIAKKNLAEPLVLRLPVDGVLPVHTPGDEEDHICYMVLLDEHGAPLTKVDHTNFYSDMKARAKDGGNTAGGLMEKLLEGYGGDMPSVSHTSELDVVFADTIMASLKKRVSNGVYGSNVKLPDTRHYFRIMMMRALERKRTDILFLPAELVNYIAFDYNLNGIGKSLLENGKTMASVRSTLLYANTMAAIKNSVGRVGLDITLDERDPNPQETVEALVTDFMQNRITPFPGTITRPDRITEYLKKASIDLKVSGNTRYPDTSVDISDNTSSATMVDTDLEENLKRKHLESMGIPPELVDVTMDVDFATNLASSNLLWSKQIAIYQRTFCAKIKDFIIKYIHSSPQLYTLLIEAVKEDLLETATELEVIADSDSDSDVLIDADTGEEVDADTKATAKEKRIAEETFLLLLDSLDVSLPYPDTASITAQMEALDAYTDALDTALEAYIGEDMLADMIDSDMGDAIEPMRVAIRNIYLRKYLSENNLLPELNRLVADITDGDSTLFKEHAAYTEGLMGNISELLRSFKRRDKEFENDVEDDETQIDEEREAAQDAKDAAEEEAERLRNEDDGDTSGDSGESDTDDGTAGSEGEDDSDEGDAVSDDAGSDDSTDAADAGSDDSSGDVDEFEETPDGEDDAAAPAEDAAPAADDVDEFEETPDDDVK